MKCKYEVFGNSPGSFSVSADRLGGGIGRERGGDVLKGHCSSLVEALGNIFLHFSNFRFYDPLSAQSPTNTA